MRALRILMLLCLPACKCTTATDADGNKVTHVTLPGMEPIKREVHVEAPVTVDAVRARNKPPEVVAEVRPVTVTWDSSSATANCGHAGIACALVLLLPKGSGSSTYQQASITDHGKLTYEATFTTGGEFENARIVDGTRVRYVELLRAGAISRELIVVTKEATVAADGKESEARPVSILSQVDLGPAYLKAMVRDQTHSRLRIGLTLNEMKRIVSPEDAQKLARIMVASELLDDKAKTAIKEELPSAFEASRAH